MGVVKQTAKKLSVDVGQSDRQFCPFCLVLTIHYLFLKFH